MAISKNKEMSYKIELDVNNHNNGYIKAEVFHCDFDFNSLLNQIAFAVGYLQGYLYSVESSNEGGE